MRKTGGTIAIFAGVFGVLAALMTLIVGGVGSALQADNAKLVVGLGWGGLVFSSLTIILGAVCVSAPYLLQAWLNEIPDQSVQIICLLSFSFAVNMTTGVAMTLVVSDGAPGLVAQTATMLVVLNVAATLAAAPIFGLWGVLIATVLAQVLASGVFLVRWHRRYSLGMRTYFEAVGKPSAVVFGTALPFALWYLFGNGAIPDGRPLALVGVALTGGVYIVACWLLESHWEMLPDRLNYRSVRRRFGRARPA